jgi:hypothetical protein
MFFVFMNSSEPVMFIIRSPSGPFIEARTLSNFVARAGARVKGCSSSTQTLFGSASRPHHAAAMVAV